MLVSADMRHCVQEGLNVNDLNVHSWVPYRCVGKMLCMQWCIIVFGSADVTWLSWGDGGRGAQEWPPARGKFSKTGLLIHSEKIVKGGDGNWISPLCTVLKFKHQSVIWTCWVCSLWVIHLTHKVYLVLSENISSYVHRAFTWITLHQQRTLTYKTCVFWAARIR